MNLSLDKHNFVHVAPNLTFEVETFLMSSLSEYMAQLLSQYFEFYLVGRYGPYHIVYLDFYDNNR